MLKQRVITALILMSLVVLAVLYLPNHFFSLLVLIIFAGFGGWEWAQLTACKRSYAIAFMVALFSAAGLSALFLYYFQFSPFIFAMLAVAVWLLLFILLATYSHDSQFHYQSTPLLRIIAFFVLIPAWLSLTHLQAYYMGYVLYLILLISVADTSAYFSGRKFGRNKLAPELSPGKTKEGLYGALIASALCAVLAAWLFAVPYRLWGYFVLLSLVVVSISVAGDLFESLLKRVSGHKDSGCILPGHGGVLDRIDSLLAATPFFVVGLAWIAEDLPTGGGL